MTVPEGERHPGMWRVTAVDPPAWVVFDDVFAGADGKPIPDLPATRSASGSATRRGHADERALEDRNS